MDCHIGESISQSCYTLAAWDYVVFALLLVTSGGIGVFVAYRARNKPANTEEYLLGGRKMSVLPVSLSLTSGFMSAIAVLGLPAEFYLYGTMFWWFNLSYLVMAVVVSEIYIPIFYRLQVTSTYEYLEMRFNKPVRLIATSVYIIASTLYVGVVIFAPSLALNAVTGLGLWWSVVLTASVCIIYTSLGGVKAVVWSNALQCLVMWSGLIAVVIQGTLILGGFNNVWKIASDGGRVEIVNFDFDPKTRHTFWTVTIGGSLYWIGGYGTSQTISQKYVSCKSIGQAKLALFLNLIGLWIMLILVGLAGLVMYAYYAGCDPYDEGWVMSTDQIIPYFVMELFHDYPGLPGLFVCSAFSGTLSTGSSAISGMATVTLQDYIIPFKKLSAKKQVIVSKVLVVFYGVVCTVFAYLTSKIGTVLEVAFAVNGIVNGVMVGLFTLGMIFPWTNSKGAVVGTVAGLAITTWVYIGSTIYPPTPEMTQILPRCTEMCNSTGSDSCSSDFFPISTTTVLPLTTTSSDGSTDEIPGVANLYQVSYLYHNLIGFLSNVVIGLIVSFLTGFQKPSDLPPETIHPFFDHFMFKWLPEGTRTKLWCGVRHNSQDDDKEISEKFDGTFSYISFDDDLHISMSDNKEVSSLKYEREEQVTYL